MKCDVKHYLNEVPLEDGIKRIVVCTYWDADAKPYICAVHKALFEGHFEKFIPSQGRAVYLESAGRFSATKLQKLHEGILEVPYVREMIEYVDNNAESF
jgi:hypothetical protein